MPLPIPANPCERTFLAVFLYEHSSVCAKWSDQDESSFLLPPSRRFLITEMRGFSGICPPCYKKQNTQWHHNVDLIKKKHLQPQGPRQSLSFKESTAFQDETLSSPRSGNRGCAQGMDRLLSPGGSPPRGTARLLQRSGSHGVPHASHRQQQRPAHQQPNTPTTHLTYQQISSASTRCQHEGYRPGASPCKPGTALPCTGASSHQLLPRCTPGAASRCCIISK